MKADDEIKNATPAEKNTVIAVLVNSGCRVSWETKKEGNTKRKVLVVDDEDKDIHRIDIIGKEVFLTPEAAGARAKELQEE